MRYLERMRRLACALAAAAVMALAGPSHASLTPSEAEQVRRGLQTATDLPRVRALIARPDLSSDEAAAAVTAGLTTTPVDAAHVAFLQDLVFSEAAATSRPVLAVAAVRGVLARADAVISQHTLDLERNPAALAELARVYAWVEQVASANPAANVPESARAQCARAVTDHLTRNATTLSPQVAVGSRVARMRAQIAIALLDLMPDAPTRRIDAADALSMTGSRRALLVERGVLALDAGGPDARVAPLRLLLDRLPALREGLEAIVVGGDAASLSARSGAILVTPDDPGGNAGPAVLWGSDVRSPPGDGWTIAAARGLATAALARAVARNDALRAQVERDGGVSEVSAMTAMVVIDGPLALEAAAARLLGGARESAARLADAIGALAVLSPPAPSGAAGLTVLVGPAANGPAAAQLTRVVTGVTGAAMTFRLDGHTWLFDRDDTGAVTGLRRDGVPVTKAMLAAARP
jgi:hypothetical protein